jgi:hypothetical protein
MPPLLSSGIGSIWCRLGSKRRIVALYWSCIITRCQIGGEERHQETCHGRQDLHRDEE